MSSHTVLQRGDTDLIGRTPDNLRSIQHLMTKPPATCTGGLYQSQIALDLVTRAAVATTATAAAAIFAGLSFVDVQRSAAQVRSVELLDGSGAFFLR